MQENINSMHGTSHHTLQEKQDNDGVITTSSINCLGLLEETVEPQE